MFKNSYQGKLFTILSSSGSKPLEIWESHVKHGYINRFLDQEIKALVLEIGGINVSTTYIECPKKGVLSIKLPFLVLIVKNLQKYFAFEVTILDDSGCRRRFRVANFQSSTLVTPTCTKMPICLEAGWNQILFNLADFTRRAYNKHYMELLKVKINANIRIRRIYAANRIYQDEELPTDFKLYTSPVKSAEAETVRSEQDKENVAPSTSKENIPKQQDNDFAIKMPAFLRRDSSGINRNEGFKRRDSSRLTRGTEAKPLQDTTNIPQETAENQLLEEQIISETIQLKQMSSEPEAEQDLEVFLTSRRSTAARSQTMQIEDALYYIPSAHTRASKVIKKISVFHPSGTAIENDSTYAAPVIDENLSENLDNSGKLASKTD